jgi:hypothetical protein
MFILKNKTSYIIAAPRIRRSEGCLTGPNKSDAIKFDTAEQAREWINAIRDRQIGQGFKRHELARATVVTI